MPPSLSLHLPRVGVAYGSRDEDESLVRVRRLLVCLALGCLSLLVADADGRRIS
jgi:hypothetical protein